MSCFPRMCGKSKKTKVPSTEEVVEKLEKNKIILINEQENLEIQIEECKTDAKNNAAKNKGAALRALQKKKRIENKLQQVFNTLTSLEQQIDAVNESKRNANIVISMKEAGKVIKKANKKLDNKVHRLMDEISQQQDVGNEISNAIRNSLALEVDEEELMRELDQLEDEIIKQNLPQVPVEVDIVFTDKQEPRCNKKIPSMGEIKEE